jgi:hypothetical protein
VTVSDATVLAYGVTTGALAVPSAPESLLVIAGTTLVETVVPLVLFTE